MPNVTEPLREIDGNGHAPDPPAESRPRCPWGRTYSKYTGEYTIDVGYEALTGLMELVDQVWQDVEDAFPIGEALGNGFAAVMQRIEDMREWTGWAGVPGVYTGGTA